MSPLLKNPQRRREAAWAALGSRTFDLLVIGGGVTGCGIARDAALRGFSVALVEKNDFASGTSSKSSKLIHGGLRYLEHAQFKLVFEGTNERALLLKRAPHLVKPLAFLVPAYKLHGRGLLQLDVGLWIYDALSKFSSPKLHKTYRAQRILELEPELRKEALKGGIVYYDALSDDARITLENALDAEAQGATVVNHARVMRLLRAEDGRVVGAEIVSCEPDEAAVSSPVAVKARVVVNATGPWSDEVRALVGEQPILKPTKGVHVVVDAARLPARHAVVMLARRDKRVMFAIPWGQNRVIIGTTDTFYDGTLDHVWATGDDVDYLLETANHYFPGAGLQHEDVLSTWAGLRPLLRPNSGVESASDVSREHHLIERPGFVTIAGGKLTTYRRMAAEVVDRVGVQLGRVPISTTENRPLPGAQGLEGEVGLGMLAAELRAGGLGEAVVDHWVNTYGVRARELVRRIAIDPGGAASLDPELPYSMAEVDEAVEGEMGRTLCDVLGRRVPLLLRGRDQGLGIAAVVAERMARLLGWSAARTREEHDRYVALVDETRRFRK
jgi:glycerol-3-phosphate dehydrogenase